MRATVDIEYGSGHLRQRCRTHSNGASGPLHQYRAARYFTDHMDGA